MKPFCFILAFLFSLFAGMYEARADQTYAVKKGDNLYKIAKKFKVDPASIQDANNLDSDRLKPGLKLVIPEKDTAGKRHASRENISSPVSKNKTQGRKAETATAEPSLPDQERSYHTVRKGDTLSSIAREYSLSLKDLKEMNGITKSAKLRPGQRLLVQRAGPRTYTVKKGDTIWKIAKRFGLSAEELLDLNELESAELKPGQKLLLEEWTEQQDVKSRTIMSRARLAEDIERLSESPELESLGMKDRLILFAKKMLNIPYRFGGSTFMGIDCSGYVQKVFGFLNVPLPRTAREQFHIGEPVSREELSMGDLVFFRTYASFPSHVGIYLGNNLFIHASSKNRKVSIDSLDAPYYIKRFIGAKRLFQEELERKMEPDEKG